MKKITFRVNRREEGQSLVEFLSRHLGMSKSKAKQVVDGRNVFVERRRVWMAKHVLQPGNVVEVLLTAGAPVGTTPLTLLYEDDDYIVVNKPSGLLANGPDSTETRLRGQLGAPGIVAVHRIDKDTSGCLLFARSSEAMEQMVQMFRCKLVRKTYHVIVAGRLQTSGKTLTSPLEGQTAVTHIRTLDTSRQASHLLVRLETGRTHQIRKHLSAQGHPIVGDRYYKTRRALDARAMEIGRHMIHAFELEFPHPVTRAKVRTRAPLPRDFRNCLIHLRLT